MLQTEQRNNHKSLHVPTRASSVREASLRVSWCANLLLSTSVPSIFSEPKQREADFKPLEKDKRLHLYHFLVQSPGSHTFTPGSSVLEEQYQHIQTCSTGTGLFPETSPTGWGWKDAGLHWRRRGRGPGSRWLALTVCGSVWQEVPQKQHC